MYMKGFYIIILFFTIMRMELEKHLEIGVFILYFMQKVLSLCLKTQFFQFMDFNYSLNRNLFPLHYL